jgi:predicted NUDIX family NTP pyrophosphohydrolase
MKQSAGLLVFRRQGSNLEVFLAHPGGPFWSKKDVWSIPKGEVEEGEDFETTARREFEEECGLELPKNDLIDLGSAKQPGKINFIWAVEGDLDVSKFICKSTFSMEWPPKSGQEQEFVENDRVAWFDISKAQDKVFKNQQIFLKRLAEVLEMDISHPEQQTLL